RPRPSGITNGDIDIDARTDMPDFNRAPADDPGAVQSMPSPARHYPLSSPAEASNGDLRSPPQAQRRPMPPPMPPPGGERAFDPLTSAWPGAADESPAARPWTEASTYDPLFDRGPAPGGYPGPGAHPSNAAPTPPPPKPRVSVSTLRHEERPNNGQPGARPTSAPSPEPPPGYQRSSYTDTAHRPAPLYRDDSYPPDFDSADPLGISAGVASTAIETPPHSPISTVYPAPPPLPLPVADEPVSPYSPPVAAEQSPGASTAPIALLSSQDRPFLDSDGFPGGGRAESSPPDIQRVPAPYPDDMYPDGRHPDGRYPDSHQPSTEYPAPAPGIRPAGHDTAADTPALTPSPNGAPGRLMTSALLPAQPDSASRGWRKLVFKASGGTINPGPSADEVRHRRLITHIRTPLYDCHRIAVMSLKGGVGKTTTTVALGSTLASLRGDRVVAIDANPDRGTLGAKVPRTCTNTVRDLLDNAGSLDRYVDVRRYLSQADSRLEVLASANAPEISQAFADTDYLAVDGILQRHYSILLTDCGTGILHSAMPAVLRLADTLVIVSSSSADGGSSASATLDWLDAHGYAAQVRAAVTVISTFPTNGESVDLSTLEQHFTARTRRVVRVPYDPHLAIGGRIMLEGMRKATRQAFLEIAGAVAERFGQTGSRPVPTVRSAGDRGGH
ncbi:MinD/ParA family protein, partial [Frankia sp. CiP3]|uniref:MinD/ParA family ATP-binding protein n=4 Tax=unclassified Frankia TaxID=2632575 RepID=UPI001EF3FDCD